MKHYYPAIFEPTDGAFVITVPDVKGCVTQGEGNEQSAKVWKISPRQRLGNVHSNAGV